MPGPGAPTTVITINFNNLSDAFSRITTMCERFKATREKVKNLVTSLYDYLMKDERQDQETQTDFEREEVQADFKSAEKILEHISELESEEDRNYLFQNMFHIQSDHSKLVNLVQAFETMAEDEQNCFYQAILKNTSMFEGLSEAFKSQEVEIQVNLYKLLGQCLNESLYEESEKNKDVTSLSIEDLMNISRSDHYGASDERLKAFLGAATNTKSRKRGDQCQSKIKTQLSNVYNSYTFPLEDQVLSVI